MSDDGRTFSSTPTRWSRYDTNKLLDVYEFVEGRPQLIHPAPLTRTKASEAGSTPASPG